MAPRERSQARGNVVLTLRPAAVLKAWISLAALLAVLSTGEFFLRRQLQGSFSTSEMYFYLDTEGNISVWVSCFGLLLAGVLAALVARSRRSDGTATTWWVLIAAAFVFMSADELCQYHEHLTEPLWAWLQAEHLGLGGYLRNAWVLPAAIVLALAAAAFVPFLRALDPRDRRRLLLAGLVYFGGAVFMDAVSGQEYFRAGGFSMVLLALVTVEEVLELLGMGLFIYALLAYLARGNASVSITADD